MALVSGACTGLTVAVGKMAAVHLSAAMYIFLMTFFSLLMMYGWRGMTIGWRLRMPSREASLPLLLQVLFSAFALWGFWEGTRLIHTGVASFAARTELIFVLIASRFVFREKVGLTGVIGGLLIVCGSMVMAYPTPNSVNLSDPMATQNYFYGLSVVVASGLGFAVSECFSKRLAHLIEPSALVIWRCLMLALGFGCFVIVDEGLKTLSNIHFDDFFAIALASLLGPVLARLTFMISLQTIDLGMSYLLCQIEPVVTAVFAWILMGEGLGGVEIMGAAFILGGCLIISSSSRQAR